jgi:hypothetical protein
MQIIIPYTVANPEEFVALKVRLRTLLGIPAELIPHTLMELRSNLTTPMSKTRNWLYGNGYWVRVGISNTLAIKKHKSHDPGYKTYQREVLTMPRYGLTTTIVKNWIP